MKKLIAVLLCFFVLSGCGKKTTPDSFAFPAPLNFADDLKGMWVSYLELDAAFKNADISKAKAYIDGVMDTLKADGFNTVFFHVRAHGDAYYISDIFPAADSVSHLLSAGFDPLAYAIEAAHTRELSLHAWVNPYRLGAEKNHAVCEDTYELNGTFYYIPTSLAVQKCILNGIRELVAGYAIDGIQYDDYFYPAGLPTTVLSFEKFPDGVSVAEGRRAAVNTLVASTFAAVHTRTGLLFGVSPTGNIDRNRDTLYADTARWLKYTGYVDYLCPQVYSGFLNETLPFEKQVDGWAALPRADGVRLFAGLALYKTGESDTFAGTGAAEWQQNGDILSRQISLVKEKGFLGVGLFRYSHWLTDGEIRRQEIDAVKAAFS